MDKTAIWAEGLSKKYPGSKRFAVKDLSLRVKPGEVYGFLGPNGAGKTTTIRLLMNFIWPSKGAAYILGSDAVADSVAAHEDLGYIPGELSLYPKMTGREMLEYTTSLQPLKNKKTLPSLAGRFNAELDVKIQNLSKGNWSKSQKLAALQFLLAATIWPRCKKCATG
jgi:ABC-2 type transport system ATP-binding protein